MTDLEISKALALAIGWPADVIFYNATGNYIEIVTDSPDFSAEDRVFDYRDWAVIGPIAERYNFFPYALKDNGKRTGKWNVITHQDNIADTPQKAIALAVISAGGNHAR